MANFFPTLARLRISDSRSLKDRFDNHKLKKPDTEEQVLGYSMRRLLNNCEVAHAFVAKIRLFHKGAAKTIDDDNIEAEALAASGQLDEPRPKLLSSCASCALEPLNILYGLSGISSGNCPNETQLGTSICNGNLFEAFGDGQALCQFVNFTDVHLAGRPVRQRMYKPVTSNLSSQYDCAINRNTRTC